MVYMSCLNIKRISKWRTTLKQAQEEDQNATGETRHNLTNSQRWAVYNALLERNVYGKQKKKYDKGGLRFTFGSYLNSSKNMETS